MNHAEDKEAMALWQWSQTQPIVRDHLLHIPNGGRRNIREAARLKKMGVRPGVSDYLLPISRGGYIGLWVELKSKLGRLTPEQRAWIERMIAAGYVARVAYGWMDAKDIIEQYLALKMEK